MENRKFKMVLISFVEFNIYFDLVSGVSPWMSRFIVNTCKLDGKDVAKID
jgi:hypothetical protein